MRAGILRSYSLVLDLHEKTRDEIRNSVKDKTQERSEEEKTGETIPAISNITKYAG